MKKILLLYTIGFLCFWVACNSQPESDETASSTETTETTTITQEIVQNSKKTPIEKKEPPVVRDTFVYYKVSNESLSEDELVVIHETKEDTTHLRYVSQSSPIEFFFADSASYRIQIKDYQHLMHFHPENFEASFTKRQEEETQEKDFNTMISNQYLNIWAFPKEVYELEDRKYYRQFYGYPKQESNNLYEYIFDDSATIHMITAYDNAGNRNEYYSKSHWEVLEKNGKVVGK